MNNEEHRIAGRSSRQFHADVADHSVFCGGGSVASITGAAAAALNILVFGLSARRKSNAEIRPQLEAAIAESAAIQQRLYKATDDDFDALNTLLEAQRAVRQSEDRSGYQEALAGAAETPLAVARDCLRLLEIMNEHLDTSTRFTVPDLGAAAEFAVAAVRSALLMCDVNIALLKDEPGIDPDRVTRFEAESATLLADANQLADSIAARTRAMMSA